LTNIISNYVNDERGYKRMKEFKNVSKELQQMLDKVEELGWSYTVYEDLSRNDRHYAEIRKPSPAGEDFSMIIDFDAEDQAESFLKDLQDYSNSYVVDSYMEMRLLERRTCFCPSTLLELFKEADAIVKMIEELCTELDSILHPELSESLELSDEQLARCDEIYNAVYEMCKVVAEDKDLEWDMHYIGEIAELAADMLVDRGYRVKFPAVVTEKDGSQHIEEFYEPDPKQKREEAATDGL